MIGILEKRKQKQKYHFFFYICVLSFMIKQFDRILNTKCRYLSVNIVLPTCEGVTIRFISFISSVKRE